MLSRLPRPLQALAVWATASALTFLILRLGAQDTPATPWGGAAPSWEEHMRFWDAGWYNRIVEEGYPDQLPVSADGRVTQNTWAFMPLLSGLASLLAWTGWSFYVRAAIVSILASAGAALVMDRWLSPVTGRRTSLWAVALVWSSPCAAILQVPYAESLGLALVGLTLWLASRGRALAAIPVALAACFARSVSRWGRRWGCGGPGRWPAPAAGSRPSGSPVFFRGAALRARAGAGGCWPWHCPPAQPP